MFTCASNTTRTLGNRILTLHVIQIIDFFLISFSLLEARKTYEWNTLRGT